MGKGRMEAFSDGVIAIIITIMVLELRAPRGDDYTVLRPLIPVFLSYILSFVHIGIYWNNHHHLLHTIHRVDGRILWSNLHLLFWLSLVPFVTGWMGVNQFASRTVALYGLVLLMSGVAYYILTRAIIHRHGRDSALATAVGREIKGMISVGIYAVAIPLAFLNRWIALGLIVLVAVMWLVPDPRIERTLSET